MLDKIAKDGSRVLLVTPHWQEAPWYELLLELTVRSYEWRGRDAYVVSFTFRCEDLKNKTDFEAGAARRDFGGKSCGEG